MLSNPLSTTDWHQGRFPMTSSMVSLTTWFTLLRRKIWYYLSNSPQTYPNWGLASLHSSHKQVHTHSTHPNGLKYKSAQLIWIPAAPNPLQLCHQHFNHSGHQMNKSPRNWTLPILSNNFQLRLTCLSTPRRHLLLQREESHGNKFEKVHYIWQTPNQSRRTFVSRLLKLGRKFSNYLRTLRPCTQWEQSAPTRSVQRQTTLQRCKYSQATPSRSNPDAMCAPWTTSSQLTSPRPSRSKSRPWTGLEKSQTYFIMGTRTRPTKQCKDSGPGTTANLMPPFSWTNWTNFETRIHTGPSLLQQPWLEQLSAFLP